MVEQSSYKKILDSLTTAVIVLDCQLKVSNINPSAEALLGVSSKHIVGRKITTLFCEQDGAPKSLQRALRDNLHLTRRRALWKLHNQNNITLDYTITPAPEMKHYVIEMQPMDRLLRISREEAWISSQETSRNLARSMAHEIKNPLGGIRGTAQLLSRELGDPRLEEYTQIIIEETDRMRNLVDRMLGPRTPPAVEELNVHEVLERVASVVAMEVRDQVKIVRNYDPSIPEIHADKTQLIQAFLNITRNAVQALSENTDQKNPTVTISTRVQRCHTIGRTNYPLVVKVSILDNGPGIPQDIADDIFFPMITGRPEGTGLGLSIAQKLIGHHFGLIECNSKAGFTEFVVYLPLGKHNA